MGNPDNDIAIGTAGDSEVDGADFDNSYWCCWCIQRSCSQQRLGCCISAAETKC